MNSFEILYAVDCSNKIEQKGNLSYLSWAFAWAELKKRYPKSYSTIYKTPDGCLYWTDGTTCWVETGVTLVDEDGSELEHIEYLPVMNNQNKSIKIDDIQSTDVNKAIQRSLTKAAARHGLGLWIYAGEDLPDTLCEDCSAIIAPYTNPSDGRLVSVKEVVQRTRDNYGKALCPRCAAKAKSDKLAKNIEKMKKERSEEQEKK